MDTGRFHFQRQSVAILRDLQAATEQKHQVLSNGGYREIHTRKGKVNYNQSLRM